MKMYIINHRRPFSCIAIVEAEVVGDKWAWASFRLPDGTWVRRLVGSTAFFTLPAAETAKLGGIKKTLSKPAPNHYASSGWTAAWCAAESAYRFYRRDKGFAVRDFR